MANSTTNIDTIISSQASKEVTANAYFDAASPATTYGRRASTSSGLTWGYYGGNVVKSDGALAQIANGTLTLTASATSYIVAAKATGAVSAATTTTNWDNATDYWRLYSVVCGASTVTSWSDVRAIGQYTGGGGGGGGGGIVESIVAGTGVTVDNTDPENPIVSVDAGVGLGDVLGPSSSVDNTLPRFDGAGGKTLQASGVAVTDNNEISGYKGHLNSQTGTSYTLQASDSGKVVELTNASAITLTMPNSLPVGWCCTVVQGGAGVATFSAASGATRRNRQSHTRTAGQWAMCSIYVRDNSGGSAAEYVLGGDTSA